MEQYDKMNREELAAELAGLKEMLEEVAEEREMMLFGTTGLHRSVAHLVEKYAREMGELNEKIGLIEGILNLTE